MLDWNYQHGRSRSFAVMALPKVASTSIATALPSFEGIPTVPTLAFPRDPIDRLMSGWRFLFSEGKEIQRDHKRFVDLVLSGSPHKWASHWCPQAELLKNIPRLCLYRFEDLGTVWRAMGFPPLPHLNRTTALEVGEYRRDDLLEFYAPDYALRDSCQI